MQTSLLACTNPCFLHQHKYPPQPVQDVFGGERGAVADALNLNAGVALCACQVAATPEEGVAMAREAQQSGKTGDVMRKWVEVSHACRQREQERQTTAAAATVRS